MGKQLVQVLNGGPTVETEHLRSMSPQEEAAMDVGVDAVQFTCVNTGIIYTTAATNVVLMQYPE